MWLLRSQIELAKLVYDSLKAYGPKRLIADELTDDNGDHCALGVANFIAPQQYHNIMLKSAPSTRFIFMENDTFVGTPEERYEHMLAYLENDVLGLAAVEPIPAPQTEACEPLPL